MTGILILLFALLPLPSGVWSQEEECETASMRRCRREGLEALEARKNNDPCNCSRSDKNCIDNNVAIGVAG
ncbi:hypothetical protein TNCT_384301 [Trichonephila clavata]|uniref:Uncharacterized protein n=1 Tax=Trichonephila clavata TaxID=2740835 RepID=A0A8X6L6F3_TRICU|nr:hypothetical protein TNCT_384301 [Trichonephila clavata]